jgi:hypothetical protein
MSAVSRRVTLPRFAPLCPADRERRGAYMAVLLTSPIQTLSICSQLLLNHLDRDLIIEGRHDERPAGPVRYRT